MNHISTTGKIARVMVLKDPTDISHYICSDKQTAVLFEISGCPFCQDFQPAFWDFAEKHLQGYELLRVLLDDDRNPLWKFYQIEAVPTIILFANGKIMARLDSALGVGLNPGQLDAFADCF
jgi:thioredoxin-like negative regulator of GroEL